MLPLLLTENVQALKQGERGVQLLVLAQVFSLRFVFGRLGLHPGFRLFLGFCLLFFLRHVFLQAIADVMFQILFPQVFGFFVLFIIFVIGLILWGLFPGRFFGKDLFFWVLLGLNIAIYFTFLQRFLRAKRIIESRT